MKIGGMNHPARDLMTEISWFGENGFGFVDLALEPPCADPDKIDPLLVKHQLARYNLDVVAHCAWYIPISSPFALIRQGALAEFKRAMHVAHKVGATLMTTHYVKTPSMFGHKETIAWHVDVLAPLCEAAHQLGVTVAIENTPKNGSNQIRNITTILKEVPLLGLHLDSGHAKLEVPSDRFERYLKKLGHRLVHVHLSDNDGTADQHLPLGSIPNSRTNWPALIKILKESGYNDTITLEVFSDDRRYLMMSRDLLQEWWDNA